MGGITNDDSGNDGQEEDKSHADNDEQQEHDHHKNPG